jgi:predicted chitinase
MAGISSLLTADALLATCPGIRPEILEALISDLDAFGAAGITDALGLSHFVGQCAAETGGFKRIDENLYYTSASRLRTVFPKRFPTEESTRGYLRNPEALANHVYAGRNGNDRDGDGWLYRGSGLIQLTGRGNFRAVGDLVGIDLEASPEFVREAGQALQVALGYWRIRNISTVAIDASENAIIDVTRKINPALAGLEARKTFFRKAYNAFRNRDAAFNIDGALASVPAAPELSGPHWVVRYPTSREIDDLDPAFAKSVTRFVSALREAGARVKISATWRPKERAWLMHWAWNVWKGIAKPEEVPRIDGMLINWVHPTLARSRRAAREMVQGYGMVRRAALNSRHIDRRAIDMTISWEGGLALADAGGVTRNIQSMPRNGSNPEVVAIGASYGVVKLVTDPPHWSDDGR